MNVQNLEETMMLNWPIVDILSRDKDSFLIVGEIGQPKVLKIQKKSAQIEDERLDFDLKNFRISGSKSSLNSVLFAFGVNICTAYDHLKIRNPGRIHFVTSSSCKNLLKSVMNSKDLNVSAFKDSLEVFRTLSVQNMQNSEEIIKEIEEAIQSGKCTRNLKIWLGRMISNLSTTSNFKAKLDKLLLEHLKENSKILMKRSGMPKKDKRMQSIRKLLENQNFISNCVLCDGVLQEPDFPSLQVSCDQGHIWPLCALSLQCCDSPNLKKCSWCDLVVHPDALNWGKTSNCMICFGKFE